MNNRGAGCKCALFKVRGQAKPLYNFINSD